MDLKSQLGESPLKRSDLADLQTWIASALEQYQSDSRDNIDLRLSELVQQLATSIDELKWDLQCQRSIDMVESTLGAPLEDPPVNELLPGVNDLFLECNGISKDIQSNIEKELGNMKEDVSKRPYASMRLSKKPLPEDNERPAGPVGTIRSSSNFATQEELREQIETMVVRARTVKKRSSPRGIVKKWLCFPFMFMREVKEELDTIAHESLDSKAQEFWGEYYKQIDESLLGKAVQSGEFDSAVAFMIFASVIVMVIELQYNGYEAKFSLGMNGEADGWPNAKHWFATLEHCFNAIFLAELVFRIAHMRSKFCRDSFAVFDFFLVLASSIHLYILKPAQNDDVSARPTVFRFLRITRFVRVLRLTRVMQLFVPLRLLLNTYNSCMRALAWSMLFLFLILLTSALFLTQLLHDIITDENESLTLRKWLYHHYGDAPKSVYTLFEVTFAGCWPQYFRPLVDEVSGYYVIFVFAYIVLVVFALIRIISALFLKETLQVASNDAMAVVTEQKVKRQKYLEKLWKVFQAVDVSKDGRLSVEEFQHVVTHPTVKSWLQILELEMHDVESIFNMIDDGDGFVTYKEFVQGCTRLRGMAREVDVVAIMRTSDEMKEMIYKLNDLVGEIVAWTKRKSNFPTEFSSLRRRSREVLSVSPSFDERNHTGLGVMVSPELVRSSSTMQSAAKTIPFNGHLNGWSPSKLSM